MIVTAARRRPPERPTRAHFATRLVRMAQLVGYSGSDAAAVAATRPALATRVPQVVSAVHARLLEQPETAAHLSSAADARHCFRPDTPGVREWLAVAIEGNLDEGLADYLADVGRAHTRRGGEARARVNARYLVVAMSLLQQEIAAELNRRTRNKRELLLAVSAWNKLLTIHLDLMLAVYAGVEANPQWY